MYMCFFLCVSFHHDGNHLVRSMLIVLVNNQSLHFLSFMKVPQRNQTAAKLGFVDSRVKTCNASQVESL